VRLTRSTPPATAAQLSASADALQTEIAALEAEERDANAALAELVGDPAYREVEARVRELRYLVPSKRDVLARIQAAIPAAEQRERRQAFCDKRADLERRTAKLARKATREYAELAGALADLLHELDANEREHAALSCDGRELGEQLGRNAEYRARGDLPAARSLGVYRSVLREAQIPAWDDPRPLFDGRLRRAN
jgi:DNA repair exonuclease SbcCD ATPase subunit